MSGPRRTLTTLLAALALAATACGSTAQRHADRSVSGSSELNGGGAASADGFSSPDQTAAAASSPGASGGRTSTQTPGGAVASTARTSKAGRVTGPIEIGFINQTFASAAQYGINTASGHSSKETYTAIVDALNAGGGLNGRKIVPVYANVNLTGNWSGDYQAACSTFTEDHHVAAVLGYSLLLLQSFEGCLTDRRVVHLSAGSPNGDDDVLRANPYLFLTAYPTADGVYLATFTGAVATGAVTGASKLGILRFDCDWDTRAWKHVGQPFVDAHHLKVLKTELLSCPTNATDVVGREQTQIDSAVLQFKSAGVDTVIANGTAQTFAKAADGQHYAPTYVINSVDTSQGLQTQNVPTDQLRNMRGIGWYPILDTDGQHRPPVPTAQAAAQQRCLSLAKAQQYVPSEADYQQLFTTCDTLFLYEKALQATGGAAEPATVARAVAALGGGYPSVTTLDGRTSFTASHRDAPGAWRAFVWNDNCLCFTYTGVSQPMPDRR